ncbi:EI24 domain-containing protein [Candidatus Dojkabacteria bacterium]|uniref:EI24 domain-containing protein n=1 Tax=Candidatus Dojkabacteria bacterium TaxID=2099670 RepID=A0A955L6B6_9BACT|nr:EI24 domain-containing protein [Candidatus Dojkabacteria bacterium]
MKALIIDSLQDIKSSLLTFFSSFKFLLSKPKYWPFLILPVITNIIVSILLFLLLTNAISNQLNNIFNLDTGTTFEFILNSINYIISLAIVIWLSVSLAMIISSPFSGFLNEKILDEYNIHNAVKLSITKLIQFELIRAIKFESIKFLMTIFVLLVTFIINFIPIIGHALYLIINYYFNSYMYTLDLTDSASSRLGYRVRDKLKEFNNNKAYYLPFGLLATLFLGLPIINFLLLPFFSATATKLFIQKHK